MNHHMDKATEERLRVEAWVGDAILALYVREWILAEEGAINGKLFIEFTSNDFLRRTGNATGVEAEISRPFKAGGLAVYYTNLTPPTKRTVVISCCTASVENKKGAER